MFGGEEKAKQKESTFFEEFDSRIPLIAAPAALTATRKTRL